MGIPSYFNHLLQNHKSIIVRKHHVRCDVFYIDANSLIYDSLHEVTDEVNKSIISRENGRTELLSRIYEKITLLITTISPNIETHICFDGTPPLPKMYQQRQRRYKSAFMKKVLQQRTTEQETTYTIIKTNEITPGTNFMKELDTFLYQQFTEHNIYISGSDIPGEGEAKIFKHIRDNNTRNVVIYGLDSDLIMLGVLQSIYTRDLYLYKETKYFDYIEGIDSEQHYMFDMQSFGNEIRNLLEVLSREQAIYEYIFMCFLCGNDFVPHTPSINIRTEGIHTLIKEYFTFKDENSNRFLINVETKRINWNIFREFIMQISINEKQYVLENINWKEELHGMIRKRFKFGKITTPDEPTKQYLTEEEKVNYVPCIDIVKERQIKDKYKMYNESILELLNPEEQIRDVCLQYIRMLEWTWFYYVTGENVNNTITYDYTAGPLFKDLMNYVPIIDDMLTVEQIEFVSYSEITQLYFVLPYEEHPKIIPSELYELTKRDVYMEQPLLKNSQFEINYFLCRYLWEGHANLQHVSINLIENCIKKLI